jgi:hypothetical protein
LLVPDELTIKLWQTTVDATRAPVKVINEITSVILNLGRPAARDNAHEGTAVRKRSANLAPSQTR